MSTLALWNELVQQEAQGEILSCCGSRRWAANLSAGRPYASDDELLQAAEEIWWSLEEEDWLEAFRAHPRIGESAAPGHATAKSAAWSSQEQADAQLADAEVKRAIAEGNRAYEHRFGFIYIVCASGKSSQQMLEILVSRLGNDRATELLEAARQQQQITGLRLRRWMAD